MKKVLCYITIVILLVLIILPPMLRIFVKDEPLVDNSREVVELLLCTSNQEKINMPYSNNKVVNIKYTFPILNSTESNSSESNAVLLGDKLKSSLEQIPNTERETNDNEMVYVLDMSKTDVAMLLSMEYQDSISNMQTYYSNMGFSCNIIK